MPQEGARIGEQGALRRQLLPLHTPHLRERGTKRRLQHNEGTWAQRIDRSCGGVAIEAVNPEQALLRLGQSLAALGEKDAACGTLAEVGRKYPRASPSLKQNVEREQKRVGC